MHKNRTTAVVTAVVTLICSSFTLPAYAGDPLKGYDLKLGDPVLLFEINADKKFTEVDEGALAEVLLEKQFFGGKQVYVWAQVWINRDLKEGWIPQPKKVAKKKKKRSCCTQPASPPVVVINNHMANIPPVRQYTGPAYFSNRITNNVTNNVTVVPAPQVVNPPRDYCSCGLPIRQYLVRSGRPVGHVCRTTGRYRYW